MQLYQPTITGSLAVSGSVSVSGSITIVGGGSIAGTASFAQTASFVALSQSASYVLNGVSSSFAATASSADNFLTRGTLTAQTIVVQTITSSVDFVTGSTRFGSLTSDTHQFTGSVRITGSLSVTGSEVSISSSLAIGRSARNIADFTVPIASYSAIFRGNYWNSATGNKEITAAKVKITAPVEITGNVTITGNTNITGNLGATGTGTIGGALASGAITSPAATIGGKPFATHTHSGVTSGPGTTGPVV